MLTINTNHKTNTKVRLSFLITLIILSLISCEKEELNKEPNKNKNVAVFTSTINDFIIQFAQTRAVGTTWHEQDAIGIYAIDAQQELNDEAIFNDYSNVKYINKTAGSVGTFSATDNKIMLPVNDQTFDFIAYYPYTSEVTEFTIPIDITIQEPREDIHILYATSKEHTSDEANVDFKFQRVLSSVVIQLSTKEEINLQDATITIENASTNARLNLVDGSISVGEDKNAIAPKIEYDTVKNELIAIATLMPGQDLSHLNIQIQLANGDKYIWTPEEYVLTPQITRCYLFNLTYEDVELLTSGSTIEDWEYDIDDTVHIIKPVPKDSTEDPEDPENPDDPEEGDPQDPEDPDQGDPEVDDPDETEDPDGTENPEEGGGSNEPNEPEALGDGTKDNPYTVKQAIAAQGETAWVEGYIVGFYNMGESKYIFEDFSHDDTSHNIVIADNVLEADEEFFYPLQLTNSIQASIENLNLKDNDLQYRKVKIYCRLRNVYGVPGGKDITDFEILPKE